MPADLYIVRIYGIHYPYAITLDRASFRKPVIVRVTWKPTDLEAAKLIPDWCNNAQVQAHRDYTGTAKTTRWHVRATTYYGFRDVELETHAAGELMEVEPIRPPTTRIHGTWFAYECGEWVKKPNHSHGQACYARVREEYWHTPPYAGKGTDMTPLPPTDAFHANQKGKA